MGSKGANFTKQKLDDILRFGTEELFKEDCKDNHDFKSVEAKSYHQEKSEDHLARRGQFRSRVLRHHFQQKQEGMSRQELLLLFIDLGSCPLSNLILIHSSHTQKKVEIT